MSTPEKSFYEQEPEAVAGVREHFNLLRDRALTADRTLMPLDEKSGPDELFSLYCRLHTIKSPDGFEFMIVSHQSESPGHGGIGFAQWKEDAFLQNAGWYSDKFCPSSEIRFSGDRMGVEPPINDPKHCILVMEDTGKKQKAFVDLREHALYMYEEDAGDYYGGLHCLYSPLEPLQGTFPGETARGNILETHSSNSV